MRGKAPCPHIFLLTLWITPAHAGKRQKVFDWIKDTKDHPRTCGEKAIFEVLLQVSPGSPPHMRGKARERDKEKPPERITPAHAGKRERLVCNKCQP